MTLHRGGFRIWLTAALVPLAVCPIALLAKDAGFTLDQVAHGKKTYQASCASCHGTELSNGQFAPPLRGPLFVENWAGKPSAALFAFMTSKMPPAGPGSLDDQIYAAIMAYLLQASGGTAGSVPLPADIRALSASTIGGNGVQPASPSEKAPPTDLKESLNEALERGKTALNISPVDYGAPAILPELLTKISPVDDAMLRSPPAADWLIWRRTFDSQGFSPLDQINRKTVSRLGVAWTWTLAPGPMESTPIVHDGVLFIQSGPDIIQALDAAHGDLLWQYSRSLPENVDDGIDVAFIKRNIAIYGNLLIAATADLHLLALDIKTGKAVWDTEIADRAMHWRLTSGPVIANGKVIQGVSGASNYQGRGAFIVALDAKTGKRLWRFNTLAQPGEPGGETWSDLPAEARNGGSIWTAGSFDPELNLVFFGPAPTYDTGPLLHKPEKAGVTNDALYTDTTIALNPDTGKLVWHYQHVRNDQWDLDWAFERTLVTLDTPTGPRKYSITGGKPALFDVVEAANGKYAFSFDFGLQNIITSVDPTTGEKTVNPATMPGDGKSHFVCPNAMGARNWMATSVDPVAKILYVPMDETCMQMVPAPANLHTLLTTNVILKDVPRPDSDGKIGHLAAFDLKTRKIIWRDRTRAPQTSAVLATAGGIVFNSTYDRRFKANDARTGALLWQTRLNDVPAAYPISFAVKGRQYVAIATGGGGPQASIWPTFVPEIRNPPQRGNILWVFALPEGGGR